MNRPIEFSGNKMKTSELIKQAEELLHKSKGGAFDCDGNVTFPDEQSETAKFLLTALDVRLGVFARNHMQELIDRLKRYEEALNKIKIRSSHGFEAVPFDVQELVRKALRDE